MEYSEIGGKTDSWKNQKQKLSWHCPFKYIQKKKSKKNPSLVENP
jgi:hypothetical protein